MKIIADTNIFYNIAAGRIAAKDIATAGEKLMYSPVSVIELAGKMSDKTHSDRKAAARAILESGAEELPDTESFLTQTFGYPLADPPIPFVDIVKAMAASTDMAQLQSGVPDWAEFVSRTVSVTTATAWRQVTQDAWYNDMIDLMRRTIPRFSGWYDDPIKRKNRSVPSLSGEARSQFEEDTATPAWTGQLLVACQTRSFKRADASKIPKFPTKENAKTLYEAIDKMHCYGCVYTQYLIRLLTEKAMPDPNDSGDLELFIYSIDDDHIIASFEKKWKRLADASGFGHRVRIF